jgi:hypothetical protein
MDRQQIIFIGGLHRSGTSLIHAVLRSHPDISGFTNTGVPEDEGQHLQTVYLPAKAFGGPGRFGFDRGSFMDDRHPLATEHNAAKLFQQWSRYWDQERPYLIEKSPPNLVRTRFLQKLFPQSSFVIVLRHPIAVAYATQKWSRTSIPSLLAHFFLCYGRFRDDMHLLNKVYVLRYEEFVGEPDQALRALCDWIGIEPVKVAEQVMPDANRKYFRRWQRDVRSPIKNIFSGFARLCKTYEERANAFGYSINDTEALLPVDWSGPYNQSLQRTQ